MFMAVVTTAEVARVIIAGISITFLSWKYSIPARFTWPRLVSAKNQMGGIKPLLTSSSPCQFHGY